MRTIKTLSQLNEKEKVPHRTNIRYEVKNNRLTIFYDQDGGSHDDLLGELSEYGFTPAEDCIALRLADLEKITELLKKI